MADFMIRFFICNVFISGIIGILLIAKRIFRNHLSSRMQYHLWFLLLGLLTIPLTPFFPIQSPQILSWVCCLHSPSSFSIYSDTGTSVGTSLSDGTNWMNNFTLSVTDNTPSATGYILFGIWITGIILMLILTITSSFRLHALKKSALPLQNPEVRRLYRCCLNEMGIRRNIPILSTAFLKSPVIVGLFNPCIYLPIHLISDYTGANGMRSIKYMLLHELQHYKHKDVLAIFLMNLAGIIYWFHPFVWYALKEMRNDRELACDASVLNMLEENAYEDYGYTLIHFAEKVSLTPFPFTTGLGGNIEQIKRRIIHIASYQKPTFQKTIKGTFVYMLIAILLLGFSPFLSTYAADESRYQWKTSAENISYADLSAYFGEYNGSFVLYDLENDLWNIYDMKHATLRVAPNSTYKIYDALFGLEEGIIISNKSLIAWNGETYPFEAWNTDQTLPSAMNASVNWYFQSIDKQLGKTTLYNYIQEVGYGNQNMNGDLSTYWMESSLKISPVEQVLLLRKLHKNVFDFAPENIAAVKNSIRLSSSDAGTFYGKTGTGRIDGKDRNGWFIGFVETMEHTYFFATNIEADKNATGSKAAEITMSVLSDMHILPPLSL